MAPNHLRFTFVQFAQLGNCFLNSTFALQNGGNTSQEPTYFNERRNSSWLLFSHLNNQLMIDEIFILKKKYKQ